MPMNYPYGTGTILHDCHTGFILEQGISSWDYLAVHEAGHIIDLVGTNRGGYYWTPVQGWEGLADEINAIFDAQGDLISAYANTDSFEDFAVHFAYYVYRGTTIRNKATTSNDVAERYAFLKDRMFLGREYDDPAPPATTVTFEGYVLDLKTKLPIEDAYIYSKGTYEGFMTRTGYDGSFHVEGLPAPGHYILWAEKLGYTKSLEQEWFVAPEGGLITGLAFGINQIPTAASFPWILLLLAGGIALPSLWWITRKI